MSDPGRTIPEREKEITTPTHAPCPTARAAAMPVERVNRMHTDQYLAPCFNLLRCRSQTCGKGRRAGSGPSPTSKCLRKRGPGTRSRSSPMNWATPSPDWRTSRDRRPSEDLRRRPPGIRPDHHSARRGDTQGCGLADLEVGGGPRPVIGRQAFAATARA